LRQHTPELAAVSRRRVSPASYDAAGDSGQAYRVLIVGNNAETSALVAFHLAKAGYRVSTAGNAHHAMLACRSERPSLIVLDSMLDGVSGFDVLPELRTRDETRDGGILLLTDGGEEKHRIRGLILGADDCLAKPFAAEELVLRVRAILRRVLAPAVGGGGRLSAGPVTLDAGEHRVSVNGREVRLTATEFDLLRVLMQHEGRVQTRAQLLETVWGTTANIATRTVDMHIQRVRKKLGEAGSSIDAVRGAGYRFQPIAAASNERNASRRLP